MRRNAIVVLCVLSSLAALSAADGPYSVVKEIKIGGTGGWDYITVDPAAHRIYVSHATKIVVADTDSGAIVGETVLATWPLTGCEEPTGLAFDVKRHRLFSVCSNSVMTVVDSQSGKVVTTAPIGARADGAAFDP